MTVQQQLDLAAVHVWQIRQGEDVDHWDYYSADIRTLAAFTGPDDYARFPLASPADANATRRALGLPCTSGADVIADMKALTVEVTR